ncbi:Iron-sulfur cluster assembly repair protein [Ligilactobacillus pobuzihii E100301 = KCTC 13174]|uniref:FAD:protein FMN transferase n=2 Tax=Ligilactobacillus pobuzihii TaxID=449659 RepID=A0A0R2L9S8_9LACO|nr:Iron-sulfur cluster assembly repair protein [Ligilactobacillus pobuzihii E100301 = KCTC 13174]KRN98585.1 Iron-sulfur cluster assembly repair protein [Ligilactobacillus pobuzihii]
MKNMTNENTVLWTDLHSEPVKKVAEQRLTKQYYGLGTKITLTTFGATTEADLDAANALIVRYEDLLTVNRPESEVMAVNHAAGKKPVQVSNGVYALIKRAVEISRQHLGFNTAIGPLVKLWEIGFDDAQLPTQAEINERLPIVDPAQIELNDKDQTVFLKKTGMKIDLGGIAKGFIADRIKDLWAARGINNGMIDLGGNLLLIGKQPVHDDGLWRVGVQAPKDQRGQAVAVVKTPACSIVTSGIYERHLDINGKSYHHILDSKTGYPRSNNLASVTVFSKYSIDGEIHTTELFFAGKPVKDWGKNDPNLYGAVFITKDNKILVSGLDPKDVTVIAPGFELLS